MAKPKNIPNPVAVPLVIVVAGEKGGVGKSLSALSIADFFTLHDLPLSVLQIDSQARLSRALREEITTIRVDQKLVRRDPAAAARAYTPIYDAIEAVATTKTSVLIDVGANEGHGFAQWLGLVDLAGDLDGWGCPILIFVPYLAESEAIRQAAITARLLSDGLPSARLVLIENERDGCMQSLHPSSDAVHAFAREIVPLQKNAYTIRMPLIEAGSWRPFEAAGCRLIDVAAMPVARAMEITALPRAEAKIVRGDVAAFFAELHDALASVIALHREEASR